MANLMLYDYAIYHYMITLYDYNNTSMTTQVARATPQQGTVSGEHRVQPAEAGNLRSF